MSEYFPKPNSLGANVIVELDLSNYATKTNLKNKTAVGTSDFAKKTGLANLKSDLDELGANVIADLDFSNYATRANLKNITAVDTSILPKRLT